MSELKEIGLDSLEQDMDSGPVWVLNTTKGDRRGDLVLTVSRLQGTGVDNIIIPATRVPLNLTAVVSRKQLVSDNQFRRAIGGRLMKLLDPKSVEAFFLADPAAREERDRLNASLDGSGVRDQANLASKEDEVEVFAEKDDGPTIPTPIKVMIDKILIMSRAGTFTEEEEEVVINRMKNMGEIEKYALKYLFEKMKGVSSKIRQQARKMAEDA